MEQPRSVGSTQKAEQTRQRILDSALKLFATKGYEKTTLRDIAAEAGSSLGLTYRYFARKEELVLSLYRQLARDLETQVGELAPASLADRFHRNTSAWSFSGFRIAAQVPKQPSNSSPSRAICLPWYARCWSCHR